MDESESKTTGAVPPNTPTPTNKVSVKGVIGETWAFFFTILVPLALAPMLLWKPKGFEEAPYALYILALMALFWVSECIPLAITSFIPVVLCPVFGLVDSDNICGKYFNHVIIFLFGGCCVALSFEYSNLHTRISFFVMKSMGAEPSMLLLGMMGTCMFMSCWMNNTSTTAMMVPVIVTIMDQYKKRLLPTETAEEMTEKYIKNLEKAGGADRVSESGAEGKTGDAETSEATTTAVTATPSKAERTAKVDPEPAANEAEGETPPEEVEKKQEDPSDIMEDDLLMEVKCKGSTQCDDSAKRDPEYWQKYIDSKRKYVRSLELMFLLGVAAASNVGGTGVITGTGTNLIASSSLKSYREKELKDGKFVEGKFVSDAKNPDKCYADQSALKYWNLDFLNWIILNFLGMLINVFVCWAFLSIYFQGIPPGVKRFWRRTILRRAPDPEQERMVKEMKMASKDIRNTIKTKYKEMGATTFHQWMIIILFSALVSLWILRNPMFARGDPVKYTNPHKFDKKSFTMKYVQPKCRSEKAYSKFDSTWGWAKFFGDECDEEYIHDYVPTMLICFLLMILPKDPKYYKAILRGGIGEGFDDPLLPFDFIAKHTPWGPLWMLGGGFAISEAIKAGKLDKYLQSNLNGNKNLEEMNSYVLMGLTLAFVSFLTTVASNTATAVIVSPVLIALARSKGALPLYFMVPPIVGASYAFCLPISTPPNAIVYDKAKMKQTDMLIPGLFLTILCNGVLFLYTITWIDWYLDVSSYNGDCNVNKDFKRSSTSRMMAGRWASQEEMEAEDVIDVDWLD